MVAIWKSPWCLTFQCNVTKWFYILNIFCLGKIVYTYHVFSVFVSASAFLLKKKNYKKSTIFQHFKHKIKLNLINDLFGKNNL